MDLIRIIAAILLPPLGVFLQEGLGKHFWINNPAHESGLYPRYRSQQVWIMPRMPREA